MQEAKTNQIVMNPRLNKTILPVLILFLLIATAAILYNSAMIGTASPALIPLSRGALEEQYGLKVNLVSVTAAGGMVDLRLKIVDGEKARTLLQDKANFPVIHVSRGNRTLNAPEDTKSQEISFENGVSLFLIYPNAGNAVKHGTPISIRFGEFALEPIEVN